MPDNTLNTCPLCSSPALFFYKTKIYEYFQCNNCLGIFIDAELKPDEKVEKLRYEQHENDVEDKGYQTFVSPISNAIIRDFKTEDEGLDFGAGTAPVISKLLQDKNYNILQYDPYFHDYPELLKKKYDYIACCEVMEHFYNPYKDFKSLKSLLKENGKLYCMTYIYDESIDFKTWNYKDDRTHVFIYHKKTLEWIKEEFGFSDMTIEGRLIVYF